MWIAAGGDKNGSGRVSLQMFCRAFGGPNPTVSSLADAIHALRLAVKQGGEGAASRIYNDIDRERRGHVSHEEFAKAMRRLGTGLSVQELTSCARSLDREGHGSITRQEFVEWFTPKVREQNGEVVEVFAPNRLDLQIVSLRTLIYNQLGAPEDALAKFDPNRKGGLDAPSFARLIQSALQSGGLALASPVELQRLFDGIVPSPGPRFMPGALFAKMFGLPMSLRPHSELSEVDLDRVAAEITKHRALLMASVIAQAEGRRPEQAPLRRDDPKSQHTVEWFSASMLATALKTVLGFKPAEVKAVLAHAHIDEDQMIELKEIVQFMKRRAGAVAEVPGPEGLTLVDKLRRMRGRKAHG